MYPCSYLSIKTKDIIHRHVLILRRVGWQIWIRSNIKRILREKLINIEIIRRQDIPTYHPNTNLLTLLADEVVEERSKYKAIAEEVDQTFADLSGY